MTTFSRLWRRSPSWRRLAALAVIAQILTVLSALRYVKPLPASGAGHYQASPQLASPPVSPRASMMQMSSSDPRLSTKPLEAGAPDPNFDLAFGGASYIPPDTEMHMIGVYEGVDPNEDARRALTENCTRISDDSEDLQKCFLSARLAENSSARPATDIRVNVTRHKRPLLLVLMAYEPIKWNITLAKDIDLRGVIVAGYHAQQLVGIDDTVNVEFRTHEQSECSSCTVSDDYFHTYKKDSSEYERAVRKLQSSYGLLPTTFQGAYTGKAFSISDAMAENSRSAHATEWPDVYTGRDFRDELTIGSLLISLPEGTWSVLSYKVVPSSRGVDLLFALYRTDTDRAGEVVGIRLRQTKDGAGDLPNAGCMRASDYVNVATANEAFGKQLCYWVGFVDRPWRQPLFAEAKQTLAERGVETAEVVIAASFHKADAYVALDLLHYSFPPESLSKTAAFQLSGAWAAGNLAGDREKKRFVDGIKRAADTWYQIFGMSD